MDTCPYAQEGSSAIAKSSFTWIINEYTNLHNSKKMPDRVVSPDFSTIAGNSEHKWRIDLYPRGTDMTCVDWLCLFLVNIGDEDVEASCNFIILDEKDRRLRKKFTEKRMFRKKSHNEDIFWGSGSFFKCDYMFDKENRILTGDTLKIYCEITEIVIGVSALCYNSSRD